MRLWTKDDYNFKYMSTFQAKKKEPDWNRRLLQFEFLKNQGLKAKHKFLDVGCTWLRGGIEFIRYLAKKNYFGIEKSIGRINLAASALKDQDLLFKEPNLALGDNYDLSVFGKREFNFVLANSVFTHILPKQIELCLRKIIPALSKNGKFYATFFECSVIKGVKDDMDWKGYYIEVRYPFNFFEDICQEIGNVKVDYIGEWGQIQGQKMMVFRKNE